MEGRLERTEDDLRKLTENLMEEVERLKQLDRRKEVERQKEVERMKEIEGRLATLEDSLHRTINVVMPKLNAFLSKQEGISLSGVQFPTPSAVVGATAASPIITSENNTPDASNTDPTSTPLPTPLETIFDATEAGDSSAVERFLLEGISVLERNKDGDTALHLAATHGHTRVVKVLLDADVKVDVRGPRMRSALHCAASHGHFDIARLLLEAGAVVNSVDVEGDTPLHVVARDGNSDLASLLVENGCSILSHNKKGKSPLELAAESRHWSVVKVLLEKGDSSIECVSRLGMFKVAVENNCDTIVKLLLYKGLSNISRDGDGSFLLRAIKSKYWNIAKILLERGCPCQRMGKGDSPLCLASELGHEETVSLLLEKGVSINEVDNKGETALTHAIKWKHWGIVELLLNKGALVTKQSDKGDSPLSAAARGGHLDLVRKLLRLDATSNTEQMWSALNVAESAAVVWTLLDGFLQDSVRGDAGTKAVERAAGEGRLQALIALLQAGAPCGNAVPKASAEGYFECVQVLLDRNADINAELDEHYALCYAARRGHEEIVRELLRRGAGEIVEQVNCAVTEVRDASCDVDDETFRDDANATDLAGALVALLDAGADVNAEGEDERTALHNAAWYGSVHCVRVLLARGANVNALDVSGDTALHDAALEGRAACVRALLGVGADRQIRNGENKTPRDCAKTEEICKLF